MLKFRLFNIYVTNVCWERSSCQPEPGSWDRAHRPTLRCVIILCNKFAAILQKYNCTTVVYVLICWSSSSSLFWCQKLKEGSVFKLIVMVPHSCFFCLQWYFSTLKSIFYSQCLELRKANGVNDSMEEKTNSNISHFYKCWLPHLAVNATWLSTYCCLG